MASTLRLATAAANTKASEQVTAADQAKINRFARLNTKLEETKASLSKLGAEIQNLGDAGDEVMLADDADAVPLKIGDTFIHYSSDAIQEKLDQLKTEKEAEAGGLEATATELRTEMDALKVELYAKFGAAINLEPDEAE